MQMSETLHSDGQYSDVPNSDSEWFALIEPEIDTPVEETSDEDLERIAREHLEQVLDRIEMEVDLSRVEFDANRKLKGSHGRANSSRISLSMHSLELNGWRNLMETARHELVHVWQGQNLADYQWHGESFEQWMGVLDVRKKWGTVSEAKWKIRCPNGHTVNKFHRLCSTIRKAFRGSLYCASCGKETMGELRIYKDGKRVGEEVLEEDVEVDIERGDELVFLYNRGDEDEMYGFEWRPLNVKITHFTGIGEKTAAELSDLRSIDDMVNEGGELSQRVEDAVSARYSDELAEEVNERYEEAVKNRGADDMEKLERAIADEKS